MSHGDKLATLPTGFHPIAHSANSPYAAMGDETRRWYGLQFHPEVVHSPSGREILRNFAYEVCGSKGGWESRRDHRAVDRDDPGEGRRWTGHLRLIRWRRFRRCRRADRPCCRRPIALYLRR